jgi:hypothetical protein
MAQDFPSRRAPDGLKNIEFAREDGSIRTITVRDGLLKASDAQDDQILAGFGFAVADEPPKSKRTAKATAARQAKREQARQEREEREAAEAAAANREVGEQPEGKQ